MPETMQSFKAELFKALAHPLRIRILELLRAGEKSVGEIQQGLSAEGSTVSQQLAVLRMRNLVDTRKEGNLIYYRLHNGEVSQLLDVARRIFDSHLLRLQKLNGGGSSSRSAVPAPARGRKG